MQETLAEYQARLQNYLKDQDPIQVQAATAKRIENLMKGVSRRRLTRCPAPGKWSVGEIIAHLADDELVGAYRMRRILEEPGTAIEAFDQEKWAATGKYASRDPKKSLELFRALREANLALLRSIHAAQREHHGVHAERGSESIERMVEHFACHDLNHLKQIESILGKRRTARKRW